MFCLYKLCMINSQKWLYSNYGDEGCYLLTTLDRKSLCRNVMYYTGISKEDSMSLIELESHELELKLNEYLDFDISLNTKMNKLFSNEDLFIWLLDVYFQYINTVDPIKNFNKYCRIVVPNNSFKSYIILNKECIDRLYSYSIKDLIKFMKENINLITSVSSYIFRLSKYNRISLKYFGII